MDPSVASQTIQKKHGKGRRIIVAVDEGEHSIYALEWALETLFVGKLTDDHLLVLYAKSPHSNLSGPAFVLTSEAITTLERYDEGVISRIKTTVNELCAERQVNVEIQVVLGDARDVLTETAKKFNADFLVMGSHGFGAIKRALLGSVSDYCAHHVSCPVVIVKMPDEES